MFVKTLTSDDKCCFLNRGNLMQPIQMQFFKKQKSFSELFSAFLKSTLTFEHFEKQLPLIAYIFPQFQTLKYMVRQICQKSHIRKPFNKQHGKQSQTLLKASRQQLCHIYWSLLKKLGWKKFPLVICKILRLFLNTFTADDKCSLVNRDNLMQPIQMQLSKKQKTFSELISSFWKSRLTFQHFEKKYDRHSWCISAIPDCEKRG